MSGITERDLDRPLWGAEAIGHEANVVDEAGEVNVKKTMRLLEQGLLPGQRSVAFGLRRPAAFAAYSRATPRDRWPPKTRAAAVATRRLGAMI